MWCLLMENWSHFLQRNDKSISKNNYEFHILVGSWQSKFSIANSVWILSKSQYLLKLVSPRSPNLKLLDFCLKGVLKENMYKENLCTFEELKQNTQLCVANITEEAPPCCTTHETKQEWTYVFLSRVVISNNISVFLIVMCFSANDIFQK